MQWFYKLFVSEREVVNKLPLMLSKKLGKKQLEYIIKSTRRVLFFKKLKNLFS